MTTEKIRVNASSVMSSVADVRATPARWRDERIDSGRIRESVPFTCMGRWMLVVRGALTGASVGWAVALPVATYGATQSLGALGYGFALLVYAVGSAVCHQIDTRSFHLWQRQLPVCARCTGIYVGAAVAAVVALFARPRRWDPRIGLAI